MSSELAVNYESDLSYDANPKQTIDAVAALHDRIDRYQREEGGEYLPVSAVPQIRWSTENGRSRWVLSLALYRLTPPSAPVVVPPVSEPVAEIQEKPVVPEPVEVTHAVPVKESASSDAGGRARSGIREEGRRSAVSGT